MNWTIVNYIRNLYLHTGNTLEQIASIVNEKYTLNINFKTVHKIVKNQRWKDINYVPKNTTYRKITPEIKKFILDNRNLHHKVLAKLIKEKFDCEITINRIRQLKESNNNTISLII